MTLCREHRTLQYLHDDVLRGKYCAHNWPLYEENPLVTDGFPLQKSVMLNKGPVTQSFDIFFFFNNLFSKHSSFHWFQISWCAYDVTAMFSFQFELLYIEVLYTIKHKIGTTTSGHSPFIQDLYHYAREAFGVTQEEHARLLAKASEEKVGLYLYHHCTSWWLSARLQYLQCISNGGTAVLY